MGSLQEVSKHVYKKTRFILEQTLSADELVIKEEMYNGDKQIFGFDTPIIYKKEAV